MIFIYILIINDIISPKWYFATLNIPKKTKIVNSTFYALRRRWTASAYSQNPPFNEWTLQGHEEFQVNASTKRAYPTTAVPEIKNGKLQMPVVTKTENLSVSSAIHNSTVAYGTWSFDWEISSSTGTEHKTWDNIWFMTDMPINLTGVNLDTPFCDGYVLMLQSASEGMSGVPPS
ncbi:MAG: hypothetical protein ACFFB5_18435 [Promethearchaeota archaeon]